MALALVLLAGFGMRAMATLVPDCIAGDDGAYSYVQIRGILRQGHLPVPDFPLLFYVLAAIAKLLSAVMDLNEAIVAVVRWTDTLLPLALAFPVYGFARDFTREQPSRGALAIILAGLMSVASGHALIMAAGMIKNEAALPFSFLYMYFLHRSLQKGKGRHLWLAALCFLVASLTHISALVLNAVFTLMAALLGGLSQRRAWPALGLMVVMGAVIACIPMLDPARGARLAQAILHPGGLFPSKAWEAPGLLEVWLGLALGGLGLYALWRHRTGMEPATRILLGAATLTTLALSFPLLRPDLLERLALVSFVPGLVPVTYLLCRDPIGPVLVAPITALMMLHGWVAAKTLRLTAFVRPALIDLERMKPVLPPGNKIVMVRYGLDWWAVWVLDTHFSNGAGRALAHREAYDAVLLLEDHRPGAFGRAPSRLGATPGATLLDGELLRSETFTILREGDYFRLSRLDSKGNHPQKRAPDIAR